MSSFYCPKCGKEISDTPGKGYVTGCQHFPLKTKRAEMPPGFDALFSNFQ